MGIEYAGEDDDGTGTESIQHDNEVNMAAPLNAGGVDITCFNSL